MSKTAIHRLLEGKIQEIITCPHLPARDRVGLAKEIAGAFEMADSIPEADALPVVNAFNDIIGLKEAHGTVNIMAALGLAGLFATVDLLMEERKPKDTGGGSDLDLDPPSDGPAPEIEVEQLIVVNRENLNKGVFQLHNLFLHPPVNPRGQSYLPKLERFHEIQPRHLMETDPTYKQLVVYAAVVVEGRLLHYERGKKGGEQRLLSKLSIGVGGHVNPDDSQLSPQSIYDGALMRELIEELGINKGEDSDVRSTHFLGFINDDSNPVGEVHLGLLYLVVLRDGVSFNLEEGHLVNPSFADINQTDGLFDRLEMWSQIAYPAVREKMAALLKAEDDGPTVTPGPGVLATPHAVPASDDDLDEPLPTPQADCDGDTCESCQ